jgi:D-serine deaminase-like pyridoxal phosphate-dependent protein
MENSLKETSRFLQELGITTPSVVIDQPRVRANIKSMALRCQEAGVRFRPHFKTHQSGAVGAWFQEEGVDGITVSSLAMAEYFAEFGWRDITLAFLLNPLELPRLGILARYLASRRGRLGLTVDSPAAARLLAESGLPVDAWIKIDAGYGRTGVAWDDAEGLNTIGQALGPGLKPVGLLTHSGHSYQARTRTNLQAIWETTLGRMRFAGDILDPAHRPAISVGDTPCCCTVESLAGADEVRPGNFVFFDLMQLEIGSCDESQLAAAVACPVVGLYPESGRLVVQGGAVHLAKDSLPGPHGQALFGKLGTLNFDEGKEASPGPILHQAPVVNLSQEHGVISVATEDFQSLLGDLEIGDLVLVWPVHSCLTCDLHSHYHTLDGAVLPRR